MEPVKVTSLLLINKLTLMKGPLLHFNCLQLKLIGSCYLFSHRRASVAEFLTCATPALTSWSTIFCRVSNSSLLVINFWFIFWRKKQEERLYDFKIKYTAPIYHDSSLQKHIAALPQSVPPSGLLCVMHWAAARLTSRIPHGCAPAKCAQAQTHQASLEGAWNSREITLLLDQPHTTALPGSTCTKT